MGIRRDERDLWPKITFEGEFQKIGGDSREVSATFPRTKRRLAGLFNEVEAVVEFLSNVECSNDVPLNLARDPSDFRMREKR